MRALHKLNWEVYSFFWLNGGGFARPDLVDHTSHVHIHVIFSNHIYSDHFFPFASSLSKSSFSFFLPFSISLLICFPLSLSLYHPCSLWFLFQVFLGPIISCRLNPLWQFLHPLNKCIFIINISSNESFFPFSVFNKGFFCHLATKTKCLQIFFRDFLTKSSHQN